MGELPASLFFNATMFLLVPLFVAVVFKKNKVSPIVGYMLGGIILSNFFGKFTNHEVIDSFAYFGILLLLFTVGLETQFDRMLSLKKYIVYGGLLQITVSAVFVSVISAFFGFNFIQSLLIGIALSSSSTTVVAKIIQDKGEEGSFVGELAIGILMFQDLAFIPFMVLFNSLTVEHQAPMQIIIKIVGDMVFASLILAFAYYMGKRIAPYLFNRFALLSRELLNLLIILSIFLVAYLSTLFHISPFISIFVAGIIVSQTAEHYHIFSQMRPFRDILSVIFFIYIGMNVDLGVLFPSLAPMLLFVTIVMLGKALIVFFIFTSFKFHSKLSTYLSLYLFQIDEDAFILMSVAYANKLFTQEQYTFVISSVLISLLFTPMLIAKKEKIYKRFWHLVSRFLPFVHTYVTKRIDRDKSTIDSLDIKNHIILCGYGRIGSHVGRALLLAEIPFVAIDYNFQTVEKAKKLGVNIIYGDPTDSDMLDYAECERATAIVLALPDRFAQENIVMNAKKLNPTIVIISRFHYWTEKMKLRAFTYMILYGDSVHNFIDGIVIASSYLISPAVGLASTLAVILHEIPHEIGDFAVLIHGGFTHRKALIANFISALTALLGALFAFFLAQYTRQFEVYLLAFAAANFIYIAGTDLIPELHKELDRKRAVIQIIFFILGVLLMLPLLLLEK